MKKVSYQEMISERPADIMKKHNLTTRELERQVRDQAWGASGKELDQFYGKVYDSKKR